MLTRTLVQGMRDLSVPKPVAAVFAGIFMPLLDGGAGRAEGAGVGGRRQMMGRDGEGVMGQSAAGQPGRAGGEGVRARGGGGGGSGRDDSLAHDTLAGV